MTEDMQSRLEKGMKVKMNDKKVGLGIDDIKGDIKNGERKERTLKEKKGEVEEKRSHVPLLQHKSLEEADHGTSCRTGLLIRQSVRTHTHTV